MSKNWRLALALLLLGLLAFAGADEAEAEDDENIEAAGDEVEEESDGEIGASEFAQTLTLFPDFPEKKFTQGEFIDVLCGFSNTGDKNFNITLLKGSLNSPYDWNMYIQNFSEISPYTEVKKGEQGTLFYRFFPDPNLDPRDYVLTLSVDYIDADKEEYRTVYFNSTVEIVESQSSLDSRTFFGRFLMLSFVCLAAVGGYHLYKRFGGKKRTKAVDPTAKSASGSNEWLAGAFIEPKGGKGSSKAKGSKKA